MVEAQTVFGSLKDYTKGTIELVSGDARQYVFSNIFEVAGEVAAIRAGRGRQEPGIRAGGDARRGHSPWFACAHDEFALCMDGEVEVDFVKLRTRPPESKNGAVLVGDGRRGRSAWAVIRLKRGHQALLPRGLRLPLHRHRARRDPAADDAGRSQRPEVAKSANHALSPAEGETTMSDCTVTVVATDPSNRERLSQLQARQVRAVARRVFRHRALAGQGARARTRCRPTPSCAPACATSPGISSTAGSTSIT